MHIHTAPAPLPPGSRLGPKRGSIPWQAQTAVGIDLGGGSLKLVQLAWGRRGPCLQTFAWVPLPCNALEEGVIMHPAEMAGTLKSVCEALGIRQRRVTACIGGPGVLMRLVSLPPLPLRELREALRFEAPQYLPLPDDELVYDFTPVPDMEEIVEGQMAVFLAGTQRQLAQSYVTTFEMAGLRLIALDVDCLSSHRALESLGATRSNPRAALVLLEGGEAGLTLTIFRCGVPVLTRTIPRGIGELRAAVSEGLEIGIAEAQTRLWTEGVNPDGMVGSFCEPWLRSVAEAVGRSLEFFLIQNRFVNIHRVYLSGPWAALPYLEAAFRNILVEATGDRPEAMDPFWVQCVQLGNFPAAPGADVNAAGAGPALLGAVGAALRGGGGR